MTQLIRLTGGIFIDPSEVVAVTTVAVSPPRIAILFRGNSVPMYTHTEEGVEAIAEEVAGRINAALAERNNPL